MTDEHFTLWPTSTGDQYEFMLARMALRQGTTVEALKAAFEEDRLAALDELEREEYEKRTRLTMLPPAQRKRVWEV
jgi:hypothetical protein